MPRGEDTAFPGTFDLAVRAVASGELFEGDGGGEVVDAFPVFAPFLLFEESTYPGLVHTVVPYRHPEHPAVYGTIPGHVYRPHSRFDRKNVVC